MNKLTRAHAPFPNYTTGHGLYTGNYYATTWPGHIGFAYLFSEPFSEKQRSWRHGFQDALDYAARVSHIMRASVPKVDIVKYSKQSITTIVAGQEPPGLIRKGDNRRMSVVNGHS
jgi:hypothetical protein